MTTQQNNESPYQAENFDRQTVLRDIAKQMAVGAGVAAAVIIGPALFIYFFYLIGTLLPPESKEADDPTPDSFSFYEQPYLPPADMRSA